ncbi:MAG: branched-chain amino acid ABC transporter substrate-binding protein [Candidatus Rokubacteria bacterium]|nr:branched-chain amino acid ABC transporter substrate-binding protein [Candidatus Rokubacteria bacterium]
MRLRAIVPSLALLLALGLLLGLPGGGIAQQKVLKIGLSMPVTGADADGSEAILKGALMGIDDVNAKGGAGGYKFEAVVYDSATPAAGQYDPAQAATNHRKFIADSLVVAAVGPVMSGEGKAISPILSEADMATVTPSSTNPDITDPKFKDQYRPKGKAVYFRHVTTDAYQGPNMANYLFHKANVRSVYVLDDGGAFGVGIADSFQRRAKELGMKVLGRDQLNPKEADYKTILTKLKGLKPDAIYFGGCAQAGVKLARQSYEIMPQAIKAGSDCQYDLDLPRQAGKDATEGWYASQASPELLSDPKLEQWVSQFKAKQKREPTNYSITAYNAVLVVADAVERVVKSGKPVTRSNVRDAIQTTKLNTLQGPVEYDENGDIKSKVITIYQFRDGQLKYLGIAPEK